MKRTGAIPDSEWAHIKAAESPTPTRGKMSLEIGESGYIHYRFSALVCDVVSKEVFAISNQSLDIYNVTGDSHDTKIERKRDGYHLYMTPGKKILSYQFASSFHPPASRFDFIFAFLGWIPSPSPPVPVWIHSVDQKAEKTLPLRHRFSVIYDAWKQGSQDWEHYLEMKNVLRPFIRVDALTDFILDDLCEAVPQEIRMCIFSSSINRSKWKKGQCFLDLLGAQQLDPRIGNVVATAMIHKGKLSVCCSFKSAASITECDWDRSQNERFVPIDSLTLEDTNGIEQIDTV